MGRIRGSPLFGEQAGSRAGRRRRRVWVGCGLVAVLLLALGVAVALGTVSGATAISFTTTVGQPFSGEVATFQSAPTQTDPTDYVATINWGDGSPQTTGVITTQDAGTPPTLAVSGTHTYATSGAYTFTVDIRETLDRSFVVVRGTATVVPPAPPPDVITGAATNVNQTSATLAGTIDVHGQPGTNYYFEYGSTTAYGSTTPSTALPSGRGPQPVTATLSPLTPATTYHYRLVAVGPTGTTDGNDATFTTATPPTTTPPPPTGELIASFQTLGFGTVLTDQFKDLGGPNHGMLFDSTAPTLTLNPALITDAGDGSHVAKITDGCDTAGGMHFPIPRDQLTLDLGAFHTGALGPVSVTLAGYDDHGHLIASSKIDVPQDSTFDHPVSVGAPGIAFAEVTSPPLTCGVIGIHDVKVKDVLGTVPPYFVLNWQGPSNLETHIQVKRGSHSESETVTLKRFWGSKGPVTFSVQASEPKSIHVNFTPTGPTTADKITMVVAVDKDAPLGTGASIVVSAKGGPDAGTGAPITIPLNIIDQFDVQLSGLEVTQGVQSYYNVPNLGLADPGPYKFSYSVGDDPVFPTGAMLISGGETVVRMYARLLSGPSEGVSGLSPTLTGYEQGSNTPLPGSPLSPVGGPSTLKLGSPTNIFFQRLGTGAFTFILPPEWTVPGELRLVGNINPQPPVAKSILADSPALSECPGCDANDHYELDHIGFSTLPTVDINAYDSYTSPPGAANSGALLVIPLKDPNIAFEQALRLHPHGGPGQMYAFNGPALDVTDIAAAKTDSELGFFDQCLSDNGPVGSCPATGLTRDLAVLNRLKASDNNFGNVVAAMDKNIGNGLTEGDIAHNSPPYIVVEAGGDRPLTSVAHELGHALGRVHASGGCGGGANGQEGEIWPPDGLGNAYTVGLDLRPGTGNPFGAHIGIGAAVDDFMSYCAADSTAWQSIRGWNAEVRYLQAWASGDPLFQARSFPFDAHSAADVSDRSAASTPGLHVEAVTVGSTTFVTSVTAHIARVDKAGTASDLQLVLRGAGGRVIATAGMRATAGHDDARGKPAPFIALSGTLPLNVLHGARAASLSAATGLEIVHNGTVITSVQRSPHAPVVRFTAPRKGVRVGRGGDVTIRWSARDADPRSRLEVRLGYSRDDGNHWRTIFAGPNRAGVSLPSGMLGASNHARLQLIVSDGFNETVATSARFTAAGRPPTVHILDSAARAQVRADGEFFMSGIAFDDTGALVRGRQMRWYAGRKLLGTGMELSRQLPPGRVRLRLVATDRRGRSATATELVHVIPVRPQFTVLNVPTKLGRGARRLVFEVASTVRATLTIGRHHLVVDRRRMRVTVPISAGRKALRLSLTLASARRTTQLDLRIPRH